MVDVHRDFPSQYHVELEEFLPPTGERVLYFPDQKSSGGGIIVSVVPGEAEPWTGVFVLGQLAMKAKSGVYTCPNDSQLCVVARGDGYLVDVNEPTKFEQLKASPIMAVHAIVERNLLVFASPWELVAYGREGFVWRTGRFAVEGMTISEVTPNYIRGDCDRLHQEGAGFFVDLETGVVT